MQAAELHVTLALGRGKIQVEHEGFPILIQIICLSLFFLAKNERLSNEKWTLSTFFDNRDVNETSLAVL